MLTAIFLHGPLGEKYGQRFDLDIDSVAQAIALLRVNFSGFARDVIGQGNRYRVTVGRSTIGQDELGNACRGQDVHIVPVLAGAGGNGLFQAIVGIVLIVVGVLFEGADGGYFIQAGLGMLASGALQYVTFSSIRRLSLVSRAPGEKKASRYFNGPVNTTTQGNPVPVLYGRLRVGSLVISGGFSDDDI